MKLPADAKPKKIHKALLKLGFLETNRVGSHIHLHHPRCSRTQVSMHNKTLARGTLKAILNQAEVSTEDLFKKK